jgi:uncharacterized protein YigA (DUF484 family)
MNTSHARGLQAEALSDERVVDHLQTYPDFFERHSQLLAKLRLPHIRTAGATVSLVERQVEVLRDRNQTLETKLKDLLDVARANDTLTDRIHRLSQRLILSRDLRDTVKAVESSLREDFDAMHTVLVLFMRDAEALESEVGRFVRMADPESAEVRGFESLLQAGKPRCGQIRDSQRDYLFGKDTVEIGSVALAPLGAKGALGILAIGASDAKRFNPGMSTEFLTRIGELITHALSR